ARLRFADPKRFAYADNGWIRVPFFGIVLINHITLAVAIKQMDYVAFTDREAEVGMQPSRLWNLRTANGKTGGDGEHRFPCVTSPVKSTFLNSVVGLKKIAPSPGTRVSFGLIHLPPWTAFSVSLNRRVSNLLSVAPSGAPGRIELTVLDGAPSGLAIIEYPGGTLIVT